LNICPIQDLSVTNLSLLTVLGAGLIDSINPCAISVMIIFLGYMSVMSRKLMLGLGALYVFTVYATYFVIGAGILHFSSLIPLQFNYIAGILAIIFGTASIDSYRKGDMECPTCNIFFGKHMREFSILSAVLLGFSSSLFELPCTGGIYLCIISLISSHNYAVFYLLIYNLMFVLPLIAILGGTWYGISTKKFDELAHWKYSKLLMGIVMVLLGIGVVIV